MSDSTGNIQPAQFGVDLLSTKGGIYQAVCDYHAAIGGRMLSLLDPREAHKGRREAINYYEMASDPLSRLAGRIKAPERKQLDESLGQASHVFLHGSYRLSAKYAIDDAFSHGAKKPLFYIPHGSLDPWVFSQRGFVKRLWLRRYGRHLFEESNAVLAMTRNELSKIQRLAGVRTNQRVIHLPLDLEQCHFLTSAQETRIKYGIPIDARVLCYLGRLHPMKRPLETIEAVASVADSNLHLLIAGPDDAFTAKEVMHRAIALGVSDRVHVTGPIYGCDKYDVLNASDAYISLSHRENFNYTAVEALGMGLPIILSPGNDLQGEISTQECGWMLSSLGASEVAEGLKAFLATSSSEINDMGRRGREWVEDHLGFDVFRDKLKGLL